MSRPLATVDVPASSANLGSGFDAFGVALSLKLRAELVPGDEAGIVLVAHGEGVPADDADPDENLVIRAFREGLRISLGAGGATGIAWRIEVSSMIPAARGLGSSAAAIVAGLLLGAAVGRRSPDADEILAAATRLEGHPDNVAAALYGGLHPRRHRSRGRTVRRFHVPYTWIPVVFITNAESRTADMRDVLPGDIPFADAARPGRPRRLARHGGHDGGRGAAAPRYGRPAASAIPAATPPGRRRADLDGLRPRRRRRMPLRRGTLRAGDLRQPTAAHAVEKGWNAAGVRGMATRLRFDSRRAPHHRELRHRAAGARGGPATIVRAHEPHHHRRCREGHAAQHLFSGVDLQIAAGRRVAIVGPNGAGKTTLLEIITGEQEVDAGTITRARDTVIGYLRQEVAQSRGRSVLGEVLAGAGEVSGIGRRMQHIEAELAEASDEDELAELMDEYGRLQHRFEAMGGYTLDAEARRILAGLGFAQDDMERRR